MGRAATIRKNRKDDTTECLRQTADDEVNRNIAVVDKATALLRPENTNNSYRPRILEFKAFCRVKYPGEGSTTLTLEKAHKFMFYQAHREKRAREKGEVRLIDHDGSKAKKGTFHSFIILWNVPSKTTVELRGTVHLQDHCGIMWNGPFTNLVILWNGPWIILWNGP
jgi:hypothetical protein